MHRLIERVCEALCASAESLRTKKLSTQWKETLMIRLIGILISLIPAVAQAADPSVSVYSDTDPDKKEIVLKASDGKAELKKTEHLKGRDFSFFQFSKSDKLYGSLAVERNGEVRSIKFNAINYNLWLGGSIYIPFQLYLGQDSTVDGSSGASADTNAAKLVDPESGMALKFPVLGLYQSEKGFCGFQGAGKTSIGHCTFGGDFTLSARDLKDTSGKSQTLTGTTIRIGTSLLFPVFDASKLIDKGYLAIAARYIASHTRASDSTQLFAPILDSSGNAIKFNGTVRAADLEVKLKIIDNLAVSARWISPLNNTEYLKKQKKLTLEAQF